MSEPSQASLRAEALESLLIEKGLLTEEDIDNTVATYNERIGPMNGARMARAKENILITAPGPINRGVEITPDVADGPHSVILDQVTNGLAVRMAVLWLVVNAPRG